MDFERKRKLCALLLLEEEEEEEILLSSMHLKKRDTASAIFLNRKKEGTFKLLVEPRLYVDQNKFRQYFRLNYELFTTVLSFIENDIKTNPYNRHKDPISPQEKLCITLRYVFFYLLFYLSLS